MIKLVGLSISGMPGAKWFGQSAAKVAVRHRAVKRGGKRTGTSLRAKVAEDGNGLLALLERPVFDGLDEFIFGVEGSRLAGEAEPLLACDLGNRTTRREATPQNTASRHTVRQWTRSRTETSLPQVPSLLDRLLERADNVLFGKIELSVLVCPAIEIFAEGASGHGHDVTVN